MDSNDSRPAAPETPAPAAAPAEPTTPARPAMRVSDAERDTVAQVLQAAFAEGRLDDDEFDDRMRAALTARTTTDLEQVTTDLPAGPARPSTPATSVVAGPAPGRYAIAYKNSIRRGGRWRVPERFTSVVYKGGGWLDLRAAELTAPVTTVLAVAYKSRIDVLVPPGVRVELDGFGVSKGWSQQEDLEALAPRDAPVVHIRGIAYKGTIEVATRPPGSD
ncbi:MAG TPA: DUF1707 domain-containing protein [Streptosporangiaceae bacterium]|jgi:hypothetical protein